MSDDILFSLVFICSCIALVFATLSLIAIIRSDKKWEDKGFPKTRGKK